MGSSSSSSCIHVAVSEDLVMEYAGTAGLQMTLQMGTAGLPVVLFACASGATGEAVLNLDSQTVTVDYATGPIRKVCCAFQSVTCYQSSHVHGPLLSAHCGLTTFFFVFCVLLVRPVILALRPDDSFCILCVAGSQCRC